MAAPTLGDTQATELSRAPAETKATARKGHVGFSRGGLPGQGVPTGHRPVHSTRCLLFGLSRPVSKPHHGETFTRVEWRVPKTKHLTPLPSPARSRVSPLGLGGFHERSVTCGTWLVRALGVLRLRSPQHESHWAGHPVTQLI